MESFQRVWPKPKRPTGPRVGGGVLPEEAAIRTSYVVWQSTVSSSIGVQGQALVIQSFCHILLLRKH